jgi:LysR family hydrogen peroxide-inducible transcriptional activator
MGVIPTIGPFLLPRILPALRRAYPKLRLYLTEDLTDRLAEQLHAGAIDVALIALPWDCGAVETAEVGADAFVFACRPDAPEASAKAVTAGRIAPEHLLLLRDGHCLRDHALAACRVGASRHLDTFKASSLHTLVQMADNGLGTTLLPRLAVEAGILRGTKLVVRPFRPPQPQRKIALIWRQGTGRREEFKRLAEEIARLAGARPGAKPLHAA